MRGFRVKAAGSGGAACALLAFVLLFRLLVPGGYMIAPGDGEGPALIPCGAAAEPGPSHDRHGPGHAAPSKPAEPPCPYAALTAPVPPPSPSLAPVPAMAEAAPVATAPAAGARPALAAPTPPATGPPSPG